MARGFAEVRKANEILAVSYTKCTVVPTINKILPNINIYISHSLKMEF